MASPSVITHVQKIWGALKSSSPLYGLLLPNLELQSAERGHITARMQLQPVHINSKGTLHGCVSACLVDWGGSMAISSHGLEKNGLSTDIHINYVSGAKLDEIVQVDGYASKVGGTFGFTTVTISKLSDKGDKIIVATGSHTKFIRP
ncbi:MAG: hypothetical protein M1814_000451 [Vezdaea aestivalis]|nr:MAG: hypothetical protein M1814_000451 [Vezdaea aestivalis]